MLNRASKRPKELASDRKVLELIAEAEAEAVAGERRLPEYSLYLKFVNSLTRSRLVLSRWNSPGYSFRIL
jgi:hypothetical protein